MTPMTGSLPTRPCSIPTSESRETAPAARGGPPPETGARLPGGAAQTPAFGGDHAVVLRQPRAAVHVCPGSRREGPGAETPEVHGREPEDSRAEGRQAEPEAVPAAHDRTERRRLLSSPRGPMLAARVQPGLAA
uniref:Uncharacterized protein n=1 Tax=Sus scrofa TaxID=9823 RepID=A0A8D0TVW4_PIG